MVELRRLTRIAEARHSRWPDLGFATRNRRNRLIGLWLAERINLGATAAAAYASDVVGEAIVNPGDDVLFTRLAGDLALAGMAADKGELRDELTRLGDVAAMESGSTTPEWPRAA